MNDILIIGGGIVGVATGYSLKKLRPDLKVTIIEKEPAIAQHQTGNNSGVIHSGLYYKPGSHKAKNCVDGYHKLLSFCNENEITYEVCGKIVVATDQQEVPYLETLHERGMANGLTGTRKLSGEELKEFEPHVAGVKGLYVPQAGIIDYTQVAEKMALLFEDTGGQIKFKQTVKKIITKKGHVIVDTNQESFESKVVINCAGLYSDKVAGLSMGRMDVRIIPFRGEYYQLKKEKQHLVNNLIYPVPNPDFPFLGVHFTRLINGGIEAGPNAVLAFRREGYKKSDVYLPELFGSLFWPGFVKVASKYWKTGLGEMYRSFSKKAFTHALQKLVPEIQEEDLEKGGAGVRAQACDRTGGLIDDFLIYYQDNVINVCNAPSPAATSSLAIGETISNAALQYFK